MLFELKNKLLLLSENGENVFTVNIRIDKFVFAWKPLDYAVFCMIEM